MVDLINHIDNALSCQITGKYFGLCKLVTDDKGTIYPRTVGTEATKVTPNDRYTFLCYHRLINGSIEDSEELSFGRYPSRVNSQALRLVVVVDMRKDPQENTIDKVVNLLPEKVEIEGYKYISSTANTLIRDSQAIWQAEWGDAYDDKHQMRYHIYALEYTLEYIKCYDCTNTCQTA